MNAVRGGVVALLASSVGAWQPFNGSPKAAVAGHGKGDCTGDSTPVQSLQLRRDVTIDECIEWLKQDCQGPAGFADPSQPKCSLFGKVTGLGLQIGWGTTPPGPQGMCRAWFQHPPTGQNGDGSWDCFVPDGPGPSPPPPGPMPRPDGPGGEKCPGQKDISTVSGCVLPCFCLYTGRCLDYVSKGECHGKVLDLRKCKPFAGDKQSNDWYACQKDVCGSQTVHQTKYTSSFMSFDDHQDVVTITNMWFDNFPQLWKDCPDDAGKALIKVVLKDGRDAHMQKFQKAPKWQCYHLPTGKKQTLPWLQLHSFIDSEEPDVWPEQACVVVSSDLDLDVEQVYSNAHFNNSTTIALPMGIRDVLV